jgi:dTMP kinase
MTGFFVTFEGVEASGKSTQLQLLAGDLRAAGHAVRELREPGGTPLAEEIRQLVKHSSLAAGMSYETELLLMNAARAQLVRDVIRPALAAGEWVLCDRFYDSTVAYQGWGRGLDLFMVRGIIEVAVGPTHPDLTIVFDVDPAISAARQRERSAAGGEAPDRFETAGLAFFQRVAEGYRAIAAAEPQRVVWMDATPPVEEVRQRVGTLVRARWELKRRKTTVDRSP